MILLYKVKVCGLKAPAGVGKIISIIHFGGRFTPSVLPVLEIKLFVRPIHLTPLYGSINSNAS